MLTIQIKYDANKRKINNNQEQQRNIYVCCGGCCFFSLLCHAFIKMESEKKKSNDVKVIDTQKRHIK